MSGPDAPSGTDTTSAAEAVRTSVALVDRREAGALLVDGADAASFLEQVVSQRVDTLADGEGAYSLLLQPNGKLDVDFRVLRVGDEWWLDCEPGYGRRLGLGLARYVVRVDVGILDRSDEFGVIALRGPDAPAAASAALGVEPPEELHRHVGWQASRLVRASWNELPGVDLVGPLGDLDEAHDRLTGAGIPEATEAEVETARIAAGVPRLGVDIGEKTIAQEAGLDAVAIDFDKGCFVGQELVRRIRDRGRVAKHLRRIRLDRGAVAPPAGAEIRAGDGGAVGSITSSTLVPGGEPVALGYVRAAVEPGGSVVVSWPEGEARGVVEAP